MRKIQSRKNIRLLSYQSHMGFHIGTQNNTHHIYTPVTHTNLKGNKANITKTKVRGRNIIICFLIKKDIQSNQMVIRWQKQNDET